MPKALWPPTIVTAAFWSRKTRTWLSSPFRNCVLACRDRGQSICYRWTGDSRPGPQPGESRLRAAAGSQYPEFWRAGRALPPRCLWPLAPGARLIVTQAAVMPHGQRGPPNQLLSGGSSTFVVPDTSFPLQFITGAGITQLPDPPQCVLKRICLSQA